MLRRLFSLPPSLATSRGRAVLALAAAVGLTAPSFLGWWWEWWRRQPGPEIVIQSPRLIAPEG